MVQIPIIAFGGGPFPILIGDDGASGMQLTQLEVRVKAELMTRAKSVLLGQKIATEKREVVLDDWTNLGSPLGQ